MRERLARRRGPRDRGRRLQRDAADIDVYDPAAFAGETHVTPDERSRLQAILDDGYVDAFRARQRTRPRPAVTWWDYRQGHFHRGMGLRIDLFLVRSALAEGLRHVGIERDFRKGQKPSDHAPLVLELELG